MEPEQGQKSTRKSEEGVRKRLIKGEVLHDTASPTGGYTTPSGQEELFPQQHFPGSLKLAREGPPRRVGRPCKPKGPLLEQLHVSKPHPTSPAFMPPRVTSESGLDGPTWQVVDPIQPGPSRSFTTSALHARLTRPAEDQTQKTYVHRPTQVSVKQADEPHKKEKKPQKPGKYICQYCSRPCAKPSVLQKHIRSHTGERPYPCIPCGFSFKTKSNLYKHRKSHAHRIKAGMASDTGVEMYPSSLEMEHLAGEEIEDPTEGESTDSEDETSTTSHLVESSPKQKHGLQTCNPQSAGNRQSTSHDIFSLSHPNVSVKSEESTTFIDPSQDVFQKAEDTHTIKQKLALRLSERKKASEEQTFLSPGSKGSTESGYFSRSESAEQQISPPNTNAKSYAEIILGKCGRIGQRTSMLASPSPLQEEKPSMVPLSVPRTQVIEHITKLITINEAVVDTSEIDSVKPRRSSLSRRSSIESPKASLYREPFQYDVKSPGSITQLDTKAIADKTKSEHSVMSLQQPHSATETVPLLRSHSMPSSACTISSPQPFRASYSFDERIVDSEVLSHSHAFSSHPRLLKRQPAIELPLGMEYSSEEGSLTVKDTSCKTSDDLEAKESEVSKKSRKGGRVKGLIYECNICGARYKKRGNYETHKKYYCSDLQILKPQIAVPHSTTETRKASEHETWPQLQHYKLGPSQELSTLRKRRKEKSLGDEEESHSFDLPKYQPTATALGSQFAMSDTTLTISRETIKQSSDRSERMPLPDIHSCMPVLEGKERATISKEISVIQHTSSFEKSESMEQLGSFEEEDKLAIQTTSHTARTHHLSSHSLQPKLVRQHNIQVPEILVTEEPDKLETELEPALKEQDKPEEFQWPQRSQTLSQLPAEKLPPKKKRLRLAEMAQSSGDSSFESMSLTRSPSQESGISHASSRSVSLDREESFKAEVLCQISESPIKSLGHHMLTVPSHLHHTREMRRSVSEQTPDVSHTSQISENRSKSFDYGNLSSPASTSNPTAQERRKCFSVRQTSLSRHVELEPDLMPRDWKETEQNPSGQIPIKNVPSHSVSYHDKKQSTSPEPMQSPNTEQQEKSSLPQQLSLFPIQPLVHLPKRPSELLESQAMTDLLSGQFALPQMTPSMFHTSPLSLQHTVHHSDLQIPHIASHTLDFSYRPQTPFLHLPYAGSSSLPPAFFMPVQRQFALPMSTQVEHYPQVKPILSPPVATASLSQHKDYFPEGLQAHSQSPMNLDPGCQVVPVCSDQVVSLVVPVRIQTHMPTYGSAMYTTLSQILATQSEGSPIVVQKYDRQSKAYPNVVLPYALPGSQSTLSHLPFLQVPFPKVEPSSYNRYTLSGESELGIDGCSSVGGSKRMLSPAGSLELTMETQQQKRVKEEEVTDDHIHTETLKTQLMLEKHRIAQVVPVASREQGRVELLTPPLPALPDQPPEKERHSSVSLAGPSHCDSPEEFKKQYKCSITIKTEQSDDICEPLSSNKSPISSVSGNICITSSQEGTEAKKVQTFPTLHTTTNVSWCYLNYVKPNHVQQSDRRASVYANWCVSLYNPNLPGISTRASLSLLRSKQRISSEIYATADSPHSDTGLMVPSRDRKPKMTAAHLPLQARKEILRTDKEEEKRSKPEELGKTIRRGEPSRIRIFEGGYKSNEEYVYVRGRGRGKYVCEECGIRCKKPSMLKKHIRTHTDLRPYVCKHCNFAFKTKGNLTKHMKSKAHSKKCQELGLVPPTLAELEAEEGTSEERWQDSDVVEEHQFSDLEDTDDEEDSEDEDDDDDDDEESQEEKHPDPSPTTGTAHSPSQDPENISPAYHFSPKPVFTTEPLEKENQALLVSDQPASQEMLPHRRWSPGKDIGCSRAGPSRRHLLQKRETSPKCFSPTGSSSPRRGMSPCQRLQSAREVSPLRCVSPQHLSPHRDLSPHSYMSPEHRASPPVRHISPNRETMSVQYAALRSGLATPPRYQSPGREEHHLSRLESQTQIKAQHGVFPSIALPHRTQDPEPTGHMKLGSSSFFALLRPPRPPHVSHSATRSQENLYTHLPLHSQDLQRTPYPMIPIGGIQMVQARPSPQPSLLGPLFSELKQEGHNEGLTQTSHQERSEEQLRTNRRREEEEEDRVIPSPSTAPQRSPTSTYCQTTCSPPYLGTPHASSDPIKGEDIEGEG
ncbi:transcription factor HIVEP3 isoform X1 [Pelobates cultripes]|uniref:Transcription factor HIVEP3 n=1 Tax=Pelobates cultripes TaxID=61616 RepID=A0AAD1VMC3_PELCU|nr:transcription factor HIVEP3 isoform X1 [Pelobates cultripes]